MITLLSKKVIHKLKCDVAYWTLLEKKNTLYHSNQTYLEQKVQEKQKRQEAKNNYYCE